jgi:excisionase family DNA binding protein
MADEVPRAGLPRAHVVAGRLFGLLTGASSAVSCQYDALIARNIMAERWYSIKEAADRLGVSHDTVSRLVERGELPAIRISRRIVRIPIPAFEFYARGRQPIRRRVVRREVAQLRPIAPDEHVEDLQPA